MTPIDYDTAWRRFETWLFAMSLGCPIRPSWVGMSLLPDVCEWQDMTFGPPTQKHPMGPAPNPDPKGGDSHDLH